MTNSGIDTLSVNYSDYYNIYSDQEPMSFAYASSDAGKITAAFGLIYDENDNSALDMADMARYVNKGDTILKHSSIDVEKEEWLEDGVTKEVTDSNLSCKLAEDEIPTQTFTVNDTDYTFTNLLKMTCTDESTTTYTYSDNSTESEDFTGESTVYFSKGIGEVYSQSVDCEVYEDVNYCYTWTTVLTD